MLGTGGTLSTTGRTVWGAQPPEVLACCFFYSLQTGVHFWCGSTLTTLPLSLAKIVGRGVGPTIEGGTVLLQAYIDLLCAQNVYICNKIWVCYHI